MPALMGMCNCGRAFATTGEGNAAPRTPGGLVGVFSALPVFGMRGVWASAPKWPVFCRYKT
eukprot:3252719-Rhodomonas_salina.1